MLKYVEKKYYIKYSKYLFFTFFILLYTEYLEEFIYAKKKKTIKENDYCIFSMNHNYKKIS